VKTKILGIIILGLLLVILAACSKTATSTTVAPAPGGIIPATQAQPAGAPSQGIAIPVPAMPPQGSSSVGSGQAAPGMMSVAPSQGSAPANAAIAAPGSSYNQPVYSQPAYNQPQNTGIWVSGQGQVAVVPDIATLTLGVNAQAARVADAQSQAVGAMNSVIQILKNKGIADKDISTVGFNIYPVTNYTNNTVTGYQVSNTIRVKIRTISDSGSIIDAVTASAGNLIRISGISFDISDPAPSLVQARQQAMADASAKATQLASLGGVKLGLPAYITETTGSYAPSPIYFSGAAAAPAPSTPINPGQTQVSVNVQVVYAIQ
jgi:uncharacterized protein YggE